MKINNGLSGLPHGAVLALLGWLVLSQGQSPESVTPPPTSALSEIASDACTPERDLPATDVGVEIALLNAEPEMPKNESVCPADAIR